ncbi:MAG: hypothetical protein LC791_07880, partial [Acidobacteria bacterium]|nr:hypothetical protein [Acidobacteriota bacterium]
PLLDRAGHVIGINTLKMGRAAESLGFAVAADHARAFMENRRDQRLEPTPPGTTARGVSLMPSGTAADLDEAREQAQRQFDQAVQILARHATELDAYWARFKSSCGVTQVTAAGDREWLDVVERPPASTVAHPECGARLREVQQAAGTLIQQMRAAADSARRASVYPGALREIRRRYKMDWSGWER